MQPGNFLVAAPRARFDLCLARLKPADRHVRATCQAPYRASDFAVASKRALQVVRARRQADKPDAV
jgi:hypothetical protein